MRVRESFLVAQLASGFNLSLGGETRQTVEGELPAEDAAWRVGLITGPSGSGKSCLAQAGFAGGIVPRRDWPVDVAVADVLGELVEKRLESSSGTLDLVMELLLQVGLGSVPSWTRPKGVLSGGEQFRVELAEALARSWVREGDADRAGTLVIDEFTSTLDRTTARCATLAVGEAVRKSWDVKQGNWRRRTRLVAVTGHEDVAEWLNPDWVVVMPEGKLQWRSLRRVGFAAELWRCERQAWGMFSGHHYLGGSKRGGEGLSPTARCYGVWVKQVEAGVAAELNTAELAGFCATIPQFGERGTWRVTRFVVRPEFQGLGLGGWCLDQVARVHADAGLRVRIATGHPAIVRHCLQGRAGMQGGGEWQMRGWTRCGRKGARVRGKGIRGSRGRSIASFEYVKPGKGLAS